MTTADLGVVEGVVLHFLIEISNKVDNTAHHREPTLHVDISEPEIRFKHERETGFCVTAL